MVWSLHHRYGSHSIENEYDQIIYWYMGFECRICGSCCMYLGDYISIDEQTGPYSFVCSSVSTGTEFEAVVDADKRGYFDDLSFPTQNPSACRFLRPLDEGKIGCTIHTDSPAQCKYYRCTIMQIQSSEGRKIGRVTGTYALHSEDPGLRSFWEEKICPLLSGEPQDIEAFICQELLHGGFNVV